MPLAVTSSRQARLPGRGRSPLSRAIPQPRPVQPPRPHPPPRAHRRRAPAAGPRDAGSSSTSISGEGCRGARPAERLVQRDRRGGQVTDGFAVEDGGAPRVTTASREAVNGGGRASSAPGRRRRGASRSAWAAPPSAPAAEPSGPRRPPAPGASPTQVGEVRPVPRDRPRATVTQSSGPRPSGAAQLPLHAGSRADAAILGGQRPQGQRPCRTDEPGPARRRGSGTVRLRPVPRARAGSGCRWAAGGCPARRTAPAGPAPAWSTAGCRAASSSAGCAVAKPAGSASGGVTSARISAPRVHSPAQSGECRSVVVTAPGEPLVGSR